MDDGETMDLELWLRDCVWSLQVPRVTEIDEWYSINTIDPDGAGTLPEFKLSRDFSEELIPHRTAVDAADELSWKLKTFAELEGVPYRETRSNLPGARYPTLEMHSEMGRVISYKAFVELAESDVWFLTWTLGTQLTPEQLEAARRAVRGLGFYDGNRDRILASSGPWIGYRIDRMQLSVPRSHQPGTGQSVHLAPLVGCVATRVSYGIPGRSFEDAVTSAVKTLEPSNELVIRSDFLRIEGSASEVKSVEILAKDNQYPEELEDDDPVELRQSAHVWIGEHAIALHLTAKSKRGVWTDSIARSGESLLQQVVSSVRRISRD